MMHSLGSMARMRLIILPTYLAWPWATSTQKYWAPAPFRASTRSISFSEVPTDTKVGPWQRLNICHVLLDGAEPVQDADAALGGDEVGHGRPR